MGDLDIDARAVHRPNEIGAIDSYPHGLSGPEEVAFNLDLARGTALQQGQGVEARGGRAWVVEQQPGPVNWTGDNPAVPPGQVGEWIADAARQGIDTLLVFRWRMARAGQEQHHAALLTHDRREAPAYEEVRAAVASLPRDAAPRERATAAVVADYTDAWILDIVPQTHGASHRTLAVAAHQALRDAGHVVDVIGEDADLTGYDIVALPAFHRVTDARSATIQAALDAGVTVVVGPRSLVRDDEAVWVDTATPAGLSERLGARVDRAGSPGGWPRDAAPSAVRTADGAVHDAGPWLEAFEVLAEDVDVLARAEGGPLHGLPVVVRRGPLVAMGASSAAAWQSVLERLR